MTDNRLADYLAHMRRAALQACDYVRGMDKRTFLADMRTQQAAIMNLIVIGEAATQIMERDPEFVRANAGVPWRNMRGMRNRIAHGYFDINMDVVWDTVQTALPALLRQLDALIDTGDDDAGQE